MSNIIIATLPNCAKCVELEMKIHAAKQADQKIDWLDSDIQYVDLSTDNDLRSKLVNKGVRSAPVIYDAGNDVIIDPSILDI